MLSLPKPCRVLLFFIIIASVACTGSKELKPAQVYAQIDDSVCLRVDWRIKDFRSLNTLLQELLSDSNTLFQQKEYQAFFASRKNRLIFSERAYGMDTSASTGNGTGLYGDYYFRDTSYFNRLIVRRWSREFAASVFIHESLHSYIAFCCMSYAKHVNGIDSVYLKSHFQRNWERLTQQPFPDNDEEHVLMAENFIGLMEKDLLPYINPDLDSIQRHKITYALTWGGLTGTPEWDKHSDTCQILAIDMWARNVRASQDDSAAHCDCTVTYIDYLRSLHLRPLFKK